MHWLWVCYGAGAKGKEAKEGKGVAFGYGRDQRRRIPRRKAWFNSYSKQNFNEKDYCLTLMFQLGRKRFASVSTFKGKQYVNIREFYEDKNDNKLKPTKKGSKRLHFYFSFFVLIPAMCFMLLPTKKPTYPWHGGTNIFMWNVNNFLGITLNKQEWEKLKDNLDYLDSKLDWRAFARSTITVHCCVFQPELSLGFSFELVRRLNDILHESILI